MGIKNIGEIVSSSHILSVKDPVQHPLQVNQEDKFAKDPVTGMSAAEMKETLDRVKAALKQESKGTSNGRTAPSEDNFGPELPTISEAELKAARKDILEYQNKSYSPRLEAKARQGHRTVALYLIKEIDMLGAPTDEAGKAKLADLKLQKEKNKDEATALDMRLVGPPTPRITPERIAEARASVDAFKTKPDPKHESKARQELLLIRKAAREEIDDFGIPHSTDAGQKLEELYQKEEAVASEIQLFDEHSAARKRAAEKERATTAGGGGKKELGLFEILIKLVSDMLGIDLQRVLGIEPEAKVADFDANKDGKIDPNEAKTLFASLDKDKNGQLTESEIKEGSKKFGVEVAYLGSLLNGSDVKFNPAGMATPTPVEGTGREVLPPPKPVGGPGR